MFVHRPKRYLGGIIKHFPAKWGPVPRPFMSNRFQPRPLFACKDDPAAGCECFASDGAETGGAEPHIAEQSRSWRVASGEREFMRGS